MAEGDTNLLNCAICLDSYKNPKFLPCFHSFCTMCLDGYMNKNSCDNKFSCPVCRKKCSVPANGVDGFVANFYVEAFEKMKRVDTMLCDLCGPGSKAEKHCIDCDQNFCGMCTNMHLKIKGTKDHILKNVNDVNIFKCRKHPHIKISCGGCVFEDAQPPRELKVEHIRDVNLPYNRSVFSIVPVAGNKFWISLYDHPNVLLMDEGGKVLQTVPIQGNCYFATADSQGNAIVSSKDKCVVRATQTGLTSVVAAGLNGLRDVACLSRAKENDAIYWIQEGQNGGVMMLNSKDNKQTNIFPGTSLRRINCCNHTNLICVCDCTKKEVIVLKTDGTVVSRYRRDVGNFYPEGLCFDQQGCIIIADYGGNGVIRISKEGTFVQSLIDGLSDSTNCVCVDENKNLWVGFSGRKIKVYKLQ